MGNMCKSLVIFSFILVKARFSAVLFWHEGFIIKAFSSSHGYLTSLDFSQLFALPHRAVHRMCQFDTVCYVMLYLVNMGGMYYECAETKQSARKPCCGGFY